MTPLTRRALLLGGAAAASGSWLASHPSPYRQARAATGTATQLSFWGGWTAPDGLIMQRMVRRFNAATRDVQVTLRLYNWDLIFDRWQTAFDGGSPPDIVGIHATEIAEYAARGMLYDLSHLAGRYGLASGDFPAALWRLCDQGGLHAIPIDIHPLGLYINARAARQVGLDPRTPPRTEDELRWWARKLTSRGGDRWGYAAPANDVECFRQWYSLLYQYGGQFVDAGGTRCLANSPAGIRAYAFLRGTIAGGLSMPQEGSVDADFLAGRVLLYPQGPWYIRGVQQAGVEVVTAPLPRIGPRARVWANSHVLGVVNTQDDRRAEAALRFIAWIHEHALDWADAGQVPASNAARARLERTAIWPLLRPFAAQIPEVVYQPPLVMHSQLFAEMLPTPLTRATRAVMLGQETPDVAVRAMSDEVDQILHSA